MEKQTYRAVVYEQVINNSKRYDTLGHEIHYNEFFKNHPNIELVGVYSDMGRTCKLKDKGSQLQLMLSDAMSGKFDLIVTDSWDCISPYIMDVCGIIKEAHKLPQPVGFYFEAEDICTFDSDYSTQLSFDAMMREMMEKKRNKCREENRRINNIRAANESICPYTTVHHK